MYSVPRHKTHIYSFQFSINPKDLDRELTTASGRMFSKPTLSRRNCLFCLTIIERATINKGSTVFVNKLSPLPPKWDQRGKDTKVDIRHVLCSWPPLSFERSTHSNKVWWSSRLKRRTDSCGDRYLKRTHTRIGVTRGRMKRIRKELSEELLFGRRID